MKLRATKGNHFVVAAAIGVLLATACGSERMGAEPGVLRVTEREQSASFVRNFNPLVAAGDVRWPAQHAMYEPLLVHNPLADRYQPWLATEHSWGDDLRSLNFSLREGVRWSDGEAFSAADVVFTFELLREHPALDARAIWSFVESVQARGDHEVQMKLRRPFVPGLAFIAQQAIVPEHIWRSVDDPIAFTNPEPVATGPFTEVAHFSTQAYRVNRNPHYWQPGRPAVKALEFFAFAANDQANLALVRGELDWAGYFVPAIDRTFVQRDPEHHAYWFPLLGGTVMLYANTAKPPWDDVRVRKALSMAIDRELVVKIAMHGTTRPADETALSDAYATVRIEPTEHWTRFDPEAAARLLDEAGIVAGPDGIRRGLDGEPLSVRLGVPAGFSDWVRATQVIARGLREVGLSVTVEANDLTAWYERLQKGDFELSLGWTDAWPEAYGFYRALMSSHAVQPLGEPAADNWHRFGSTEADEQLAALDATVDPEERRAAYERLQQIFIEQAPAIPLFLGPLWSEYNTSRFSGFPTAEDPYAPGSPNLYPQTLLVLTRLEPR